MLETLEYRHSKPLDPTIRANLPSFTSLPIRIREDKVSIQLRAQIRSVWMFIRHKKCSSRTEAECPLGHIVSLVIPECPPGLLDLVTELLDYSFIQNDELEEPASREAEEKHSQFHRFAVELLGIDHPLTMTLLACVHEYLMAKHDPIPSFLNFEEYAQYRVTHAGAKALSLLICIVMNVPIDCELMESMQPIVRPLEEYFALCNDYFSYWKEKEDVRGGEYPSSVRFLMKDKGISEEIALAIVKEKMISLEEAHYAALRQSMEEKVLSLDQQKYIQYLQLAEGGTHAFSCTAYRYMTEETRRVDAKPKMKPYVILLACPVVLILSLLSIFM